MSTEPANNQPTPEMVEQAKANLAQEQALRAEAKAKPKRKAKEANPPKVEGYRTSARAKADFSNEDTLTLKTAPAAGTQLFKRFELLRDGMTVAEALAVQRGLHGRRGAVRALIERGYVTRTPSQGGSNGGGRKAAASAKHR